jgi:hypothetical protein
VEPYVIRQGDFLLQLAYKFGFDADAVWNDPANDDLRKLRPDPNILWPTDILHIPRPPDDPPAHPLATGQTNTFVSNPPTVSITIRFQDPPLASQPYTVTELPGLTGLTTDGSGTATFAIPVTLPMFTIVFTTADATFTFNAGGLDPIDTLSGVFQRLKQLGFIDADTNFYPADIELIRGALTAFKAAQSASTSADTSGGGSAAPATASDGGGAASTDDSPSPDGQPPEPLPPGDGGLSDNGTLDAETTQLLLAAHVS